MMDKPLPSSMSMALKKDVGTMRRVDKTDQSDYATTFPKELEQELHMTKNKLYPSNRRTFLYAWGMNPNGQLGFSPYNDYTETKGVDLTNFQDASAMTESVLNQSKKVIRHADIPRLTWIPNSIAYGMDIISVATSYYHTLIVDSRGQCYAFGGGENGALGLGYEKIEQTVPRRILHLPKKVIMVAAGRYHSLALTRDGIVYSWGSSKDGKLGLGDLKRNNVPAFLNYPKPVLMDDGVVAKYIAAGEKVSFVIASDQTSGSSVYAWGDNSHGQLGNGKDGFPIGKDVMTPQKSKSLTKIRPKKISCNFFHGLALTSMNIYTWSMDHDLLGRNSIGYVGKIELPATFQRLSDEMSSDSDFVDISAGYSHSLAIDSSGKMISWGKMNNSVELSVMGQPADTGGVVLLPTQVMKFNIINKQTNVVETVNYDPNSPTTAITRISTFRFHSIAVSKDQTVYSWGANKLRRLGNADLKMKHKPLLHIPTQINFRTSFSPSAKTLRSIHKRVGEKSYFSPDEDEKIEDSPAMYDDEGDDVKKMKVMHIEAGQMHSFVVISVKTGHTESVDDDTKIDNIDDSLFSDVDIGIGDLPVPEAAKSPDKSCCNKCCCVVS